jgi:hypothetical protein
VSRPWCLLAALRPKFAHVLATGAPYEDPGEWYRTTPKELQAIVEKELEER